MQMMLRKLLGLAGLLLIGPCAWAQAAATEPAAAASQAQSNQSNEEPIESARRSVRSAAEWMASGVDSWFGDRPFKQGGKVSDGQLSLSVLKRQDENVNLKLRFNARFRLPNVEERTYLFIGRDNPREIITDTPEAFSREQRLLKEDDSEKAFFAGLGRTLNESLDFRLGFRGGLKPYAQARYRKPWTLSPTDEIEFRETIFWSLDDHFGSTTALSYQHAFSSRLAGRWLNSATITQRDRKFEWHSILGAFQSMGDQRLLSLELIATGKQGASVRVSDYGVQARWEQPVHKDWLLGEVLIGHFWPRSDPLSPRGQAWAVGAGVKMRF